MVYRIKLGLRRESSILEEFGQPKSLVYSVLLFPLEPLVLTLGNLWPTSMLLFLLALACYVPALLVARSQGGVWEKSGTDRVQ